MDDIGVRFELSATRRKIGAPQGCLIIARFVINVEYWPFGKEMPRAILPGPYGYRSCPDVANFSWYLYGMRCGLPRFIEALAAYDVPADCALNAGVITAYPAAAEAVLEAGWELVGHNYEQIALTEETEEEVIDRSLELLRSFSGKPVHGWLSSGMVETSRTPALLAGAGIRYICDWGIDDLPSWMRTPAGPLIVMPGSLCLDDGLLYGVETRPSDELYNRLLTTLEVFAREARTNPRILTINLHPHLMGEPHRIEYLRRILSRLRERTDVVFMNGSTIADWFAASEPFVVQE